MSILIKKAKIVNTSSPYHGQVHDILIEGDKITQIGDLKVNADETIEGSNLHVSIGFFDMRASSKDPGNESMETLGSLSAAAGAGGFTEVLILPNTTPVIQNKESLGYFHSFSKNSIVDLFPAGAVTKNCEGKDFTEMWDMLNAGAICLTDGNQPIWNADILLKTLQYLFPKKALLINKPQEPTLAMHGQMHEGITSTKLGMKGLPDAAEEIMIQRDLKLLEYSGLSHHNSLLHFSCISSAKSVELIRKAKKNGFPVSCDIAAHQLAFIDEDLADFDTNLKVNPPFRTKNDIKALVKGLADGTINAIVSDHSPEDTEQKNLEFDQAAFGIISLQTTFATANENSGLELADLIKKLTDEPRKLLRRETGSIVEDSAANLTVFNPDLAWVFKESDIKSLSKNSPFINKKMKGKILATFNKGLFESYG